jgi:hypothetical protein
VIVYADGDLAVMYECDVVQEDGTCDRSETSIGVISRTSDKLDDAAIEKLAPIAKQLCHTAADFTHYEHIGEILSVVDGMVRVKEENGCVESSPLFMLMSLGPFRHLKFVL